MKPGEVTKQRLDVALVERGLAESRAKAQAVVLAGLVYSGEKRLDKPGVAIGSDTPLEVRGQPHPWVSRGGVKLAHALDHFAIDPKGLVVLDIGASTGGFTDVVLQRGEQRVYAIDVGRGQLAWKMRQDPRVVTLERTNARYLTRDEVPEPPELIVCDASFIGLATVLPASLALAGPGRGSSRSSSRSSRWARRGSERAGSCAIRHCMTKSARGSPLG